MKRGLHAGYYKMIVYKRSVPEVSSSNITPSRESYFHRGRSLEKITRKKMWGW